MVIGTRKSAINSTIIPRKMSRKYPDKPSLYKGNMNDKKTRAEPVSGCIIMSNIGIPMITPAKNIDLTSLSLGLKVPT
ncbi:hypothetical protein D3C85_1467670 [compost metagenome]